MLRKHPSKLTARDVESIRYHHKPGAESQDFELLLAFAEYLLIEKGIDFSSPGAVFDHSDPEHGSEDVDALMLDLACGDRMTVNEGYYTKPETWVMAPTVDGRPCHLCMGRGCDDWAGQDCPSEVMEPVPQRVMDQLQSELMTELREEDESDGHSS